MTSARTCRSGNRVLGARYPSRFTRNFRIAKVTGISTPPTDSMSSWNNPAKKSQSQAPAPETAPQPEPPEAVSRVHLAIQLVKEGKFSQALDDYIKPAIAEFEKLYGSRKERVYCAGGTLEQVAYLAKAAMDKEAAVVAHPGYADAYYMKGYIAFSQKDIGQALEDLEKAVELSPFNSGYLSELANVYQSTRHWPEAMELYERAEKSANAPVYKPGGDTSLQRRALRGMAFVLVELGNLDDAERLHRQCLELDAQDRTALHELQYIEQLRAGARKRPEEAIAPPKSP
jgi:tetratricopeptide (TPR) repeat protein